MEVIHTTYYESLDRTRYRKQTNGNGKTWWAVQRNENWYIISGEPTTEGSLQEL